MSMEQLSARERHALEHLRQAEKFGVSLEYYAYAFELQVKDLESMRQQLVRKGVIAAPAPACTPAPPKTAELTQSEKRSAFIPVRVMPSPPMAAAPVAQGTAAVRCRLVHPSGWSIECSSVPPADWVRALLVGAPS